MYYLYENITIKNKYNTIYFVLYYCHQSPSQESIVQSMVDLIEQHTYTYEENLYQTLKKISSTNNRQHRDFTSIIDDTRNSKDICNINKPLNESEVIVCSNYLNVLFHEYTTKVDMSSKNTMSDIFRYSNELKNDISNNIQGMDHDKSSIMVELAALVGLLPLEYYIYMPIHFKDNKDIDKYVEEIEMLQCLFTKEYTPNIHRKIITTQGNNPNIKNRLYYLPWYQMKEKKLTKYDMQLCFRIQGLRLDKKFTLSAFDGINNHIFSIT